MPATCNHSDPRTWYEGPAPRKGDSRPWRRTRCLICGRWLGDRLLDGKAGEEERHAAAVGRYDRTAAQTTTP